MKENELDWVVAGYIVNQDNQVLLIHHKKLGIWLPPGGHPEEGESPDETLRREIRTELGGMELDFVHYPSPRKRNHREYALPFYADKHPISKDHNHYCQFFLCRPKSTELKINKRELYDAKWVSKKGLNYLSPRLDDAVRQTCLEAIDLVKDLNS